MQEDMVITLGSGKQYGILLESETMDNYFLAVLLDEKEEPTSTYTVLKKVVKNNQEFIKRIDDPLILNSLLDDYREQYEELKEEN